MWILWKMRFWKCEFSEKWDFETVDFLKIEIFTMWFLNKLRGEIPSSMLWNYSIYLDTGIGVSDNVITLPWSTFTRRCDTKITVSSDVHGLDEQYILITWLLTTHP